MNFIGWSLGLHPQLEARSRRICRSNNQSPNQKEKSLNYEKQALNESVKQSTKQPAKQSNNQNVTRTRRHTIDTSSINRSNNRISHSVYRNHVLNESSHLTQSQIPQRKSSDQSIKQSNNQTNKQSTSPSQSFSRRLRDPMLAPLITQFRNFVHLIETIDDELIDRLIVRSQIHSLIDRSVLWLKEHPWLINQSLNQSANQPISKSMLNNAKQAIEKYLLSKLHSKLYSINQSINQSQRVFDCKLDFLVDWLNWKHFELPSDIFDQSSIFDVPSVELRRLVDYKSPKDKLIVLLNTCVLLNQSINRAIDRSEKQSNTQSKIDMDEQSVNQENIQQNNQTNDQSINQNFISADIFLPAFILLIIHASHPFNRSNNQSSDQSKSQRIELVKDLAWINMGSRELFDHSINQSINQSNNQSLSGECEYCLTMVQSAVCFIQSIDQSNIKLQPISDLKQSNNRSNNQTIKQSNNQMNEWDYRVQQWKIQHFIDQSNTQSLDQLIRQSIIKQSINQSNNQSNNTTDEDDGCDSLPVTPQKIPLSE